MKRFIKEMLEEERKKAGTPPESFKGMRIEDFEKIPESLIISKWSSAPEKISTIIESEKFRHLIIYGGPCSNHIKLSSSERKEQEEKWRNGFSLESLSNMDQLQSFTVSNMFEMDTELDLTPLTACTNLKSIRIKGDFPSITMSQLPNIDNLETLELHFSSKRRYISISGEVTREGRDAYEPDLNIVSKCEKLTTFSVSSPKPRLNLTPLSNHTKLSKVEVGCKYFIDLSPLGKCPSLESLIARQPWLVGVRLPESESLRVLDLSYGELTTPYDVIFQRGIRDVKRSEMLDLSQIVGSDSLQLVDLKKNDLNTLSLDFLKEWDSEETPIIDVRRNPLVCIDESPIMDTKHRVLIDPTVRRVSDNEEFLRLIYEWEVEMGFR